MCDEKIELVFVYGTLKRGGRLFDKDAVICSSEDSINGRMYKVDGVYFPFPAMVLGEGSVVTGELQVIKASYLCMMDAMEGYLYTRKQIITNNGTPCWIYESNMDHRKDKQITEWNN